MAGAMRTTKSTVSQQLNKSTLLFKSYNLKMPDFDVRMISAEQTRRLRQRILRPGQPPENSTYPGDHEAHAFHLGAVVERELVGVASFYNEPLQAEAVEGVWRLRGMAVATNMQGQGCGQELLSKGIDMVRERDGKGIWCNARGTAVGFYERLGFVTIGEYFEVDGHPHVVMLKQINLADI
jgi:predicted GNAT family N-acyltransferase